MKNKIIVYGIVLLLSMAMIVVGAVSSLSSVKESKDLTTAEKDELSSIKLTEINQQSIDYEWGKLYRTYIKNEKVSQKVAYDNVIKIKQMLNGSIACK